MRVHLNSAFVRLKQNMPVDDKAIEWLYLNNKEDTARYILGEKSQEMLACIGINPSTAKPAELDNTLESVQRIARFNGFDGWVMYNIYPLRATDPKELPAGMNIDHHLKNNEVVRRSVIDLEIDSIWAAWGNLIDTRDYLLPCLVDLYRNLNDLHLNWRIIEDTTQKGHPRHPLYKKAANELLAFDMDRYMREFSAPTTAQTPIHAMRGTHR